MTKKVPKSSPLPTLSDLVTSTDIGVVGAVFTFKKKSKGKGKTKKKKR